MVTKNPNTKKPAKDKPQEDKTRQVSISADSYKTLQIKALENNMTRREILEALIKTIK